MARACAAKWSRSTSLSRGARSRRRPFPLAFFVLKARSGPAINSPLFALDYGATLSDLLALLPQMWIDDLCAREAVSVHNVLKHVI